MSEDNAPAGDSPDGVERLTDIHLVGPATATALEDAPFDGTGVLDRRVSYEMLVDVGVNHGVATRIRRHHSLPWSFGGDEGSLDERSTKVRGLQEGEREWVAASSGDWESTDPGTDPSATADGGGGAEAAESAWRERSHPDPVTDVPGVDEGAAAVLSEAGVTSVRSLATADTDRIAESLDLDAERVAEWQREARDLV